MAYIWETPDTATLKIDVGVINGEISDSVSVDGMKTFNFGNVPANAEFQRFIDGGDGETPAASGTFGLIPIFLTYLLGTTYDEGTAKKTVVYGTTETE